MHPDISWHLPRPETNRHRGEADDVHVADVYPTVDKDNNILSWNWEIIGSERLDDMPFMGTTEDEMHAKGSADIAYKRICEAKKRAAAGPRAVGNG